MALNEEQVCEAVGHYIDNNFVPPVKATPASTWTELQMDSLDTVELLMWAEDKFGIHIPDDTAETLNTVRDFARAICNA